MDLDFNGDVTCLDAELLQLQEVSPLAIKANPYVAEKLFDQWLSLPESNSLVNCYLFFFLCLDWFMGRRSLSLLGLQFMRTLQFMVGIVG